MARLITDIVDLFEQIAECFGRIPGVRPIGRLLDDAAIGVSVGAAIAWGLIVPTLPVAAVLILLRL